MERKIKNSRKVRVRRKIRMVSQRPRFSVFRSNKHIYAQIIDDEKGKTVVGVSEKNLSVKDKHNKTEMAKELGLMLAKKAAAKKIRQVVFDRGLYKYHGRVKALADGAREGGLEF